jgi:hypothetical protein
VAIGSTRSAGKVIALSEVLSGSTWTASEVDSSLPYGVLNGVSCTSASSCTAVGDYSNGTNTFTLGEAFNGSTWTNSGTPQPTGAAFANLGGVSCASGASTCETVGSFGYYGPSVTLAEQLT